MSAWLTRNRGPGLRCECILDYGMPGVQAKEFGTDLIRLFVCCFFSWKIVLGLFKSFINIL